MTQVLLSRDELEEHGVVVRVALLLKPFVIRRITHVHRRGERDFLRGNERLSGCRIYSWTSPEHRGRALQLPRAVAELHEAEVLLDGRRPGRAREPRGVRGRERGRSGTGRALGDTSQATFLRP